VNPTKELFTYMANGTWGNASVAEKTLPSGAVVKVRDVSIRALIKAGITDDALDLILDPPTDGLSPEALRKLYALADVYVPLAVAEPVVVPSGEDVPEGGYSVDDLPDEDLVAVVFGVAEESEEDATFRDGEPGGTDSGEGGEGVESPPKRTRARKAT
jgi:hypothetical protein